MNLPFSVYLKLFQNAEFHMHFKESTQIRRIKFYKYDSFLMIIN